jgi:hypothetical protein
MDKKAIKSKVKILKPNRKFKGKTANQIPKRNPQSHRAGFPATFHLFLPQQFP